MRPVRTFRHPRHLLNRRHKAKAETSGTLADTDTPQRLTDNGALTLFRQAVKSPDRGRKL